jgi:DNA-binding LacI/PurR family transcriptional regulator
VRELEQRYGISRSTVAHALGLLEARGLLQKRHGKGSFITQRGECEPPRALNALGLVVPYNPQQLDGQSMSSADVLMRIHAGMAQSAERFGWHVLIGPCGWNYEEERRQVERLIESGCQGVAIMPLHRTRGQFETDYLKDDFDVPLVLVDLCYPVQGHTQVVFDNFSAGYELVRRLLAEGRREIAVCAAFHQGEEILHFALSERRRGYATALREAGRELGPQHLVPVDLDSEPRDASLARFLDGWKQQGPERPEVVIAMDDGAAIDLYRLAAERGIDVGTDLLIIGFDNYPAGRMLEPPLTTTQSDFCKAGELAADLLMRRIRGDLVTDAIYMLPMNLIWRHDRKREETAILLDGGVADTISPTLVSPAG